MPKRVLDLRDFSGGINSRINKTELNDNEVTKSVGLMYDVPGIIRGMGETTVLKYDETNVVPTLSSQTDYTVGPENGYGLGFVSFDAPSQIYVIQSGANLTGLDPAGLTIGNYLSNDSSGGDWDTTTTHFVLQIFAIDDADDGYGARQIFCYIKHHMSLLLGLQFLLKPYYLKMYIIAVFSLYITTLCLTCRHN